MQRVSASCSLPAQAAILPCFQSWLTRSWLTGSSACTALADGRMSAACATVWRLWGACWSRPAQPGCGTLLLDKPHAAGRLLGPAPTWPAFPAAPEGHQNDHNLDEDHDVGRAHAKDDACCRTSPAGREACQMRQAGCTAQKASSVMRQDQTCSCRGAAA